MENKITGQIITGKAEKTFSFWYEYVSRYEEDYNMPSYCFDIWEKGREKEFKFSFILLIMDNLPDLKVIDMYATNEYYRGKGIARAIILESKKLFNKRVISSSNKNKIFNREMRKPDANRVWEKMVEEGLVQYNFEGDYFFTI